MGQGVLQGTGLPQRGQWEWRAQGSGVCPGAEMGRGRGFGGLPGPALQPPGPAQAPAERSVVETWGQALRGSALPTWAQLLMETLKPQPMEAWAPGYPLGPLLSSGAVPGPPWSSCSHKPAQCPGVLAWSLCPPGSLPLGPPLVGSGAQFPHQQAGGHWDRRPQWVPAGPWLLPLQWRQA